MQTNISGRKLRKGIPSREEIDCINMMEDREWLIRVIDQKHGTQIIIAKTLAQNGLPSQPKE
jgi:hypothetical protein